MLLARQHLIDPDICIRCNTCEESCPKKAVTHDKRNYVVDFEKCDECGDCLPPCPTGAIDSWRKVREPWSIEAQFGWDSLPDDQTPDESSAGSAMPDAVTQLLAQASSWTKGPSPPPWSAAHPYIGLYSRERPAIATVVGNHPLTAETSDVDIRHIVLDFGKTAFPVLEGQTLGVVLPGADADGRPHAVRLYSIASPRDGERPRHNNLSITVKRVTVDHDGKPVRGLASNYLCDAKKGDELTITGPFGSSFLMPNHPKSNLLMICTGTGSAPMRAMTERRRRRLALKEGGKILLFFGARSPEQLPYFGPLMKLPEELIDVELAFSRVPNMPKEYVQDRMRARGSDVAEWLKDQETHLYVCGHKRMEGGVLLALQDIARSAGLDFAKLSETMRAEGRLHVETY